MKNSTDNKFFFILTSALVFFVIVSATLVSGKESKRPSQAKNAVQKLFPHVTLEAKSAYVYDLRTGKALFEKNADKALPLASLTKLMSALVAFDLAPSHSTVSVTSTALANYGDSGLIEGERWSLKNLLDFSLLTSSNDGIRAVALSLSGLDTFVKNMNDKAKSIGLHDTTFQNETGLDIQEGEDGAMQGGAYGSAKDTALLMGYILKNKPGLLEATKQSELRLASLDNTSYLAKNTDFLVDKMPGALASKTGFTDLAGGNLAFAFDPDLGRPIVVVILGSSVEGRFVDAQKLINATMQYITAQ